MLRGAIELRDRSRDCSCEPDTDDQRNQFDNAEGDRDDAQKDEDGRSHGPQVGEYSMIQHRRTRVHLHECLTSLAVRPVGCRKNRTELKHWIKTVFLRRVGAGRYRGNWREVFVLSFAVVAEFYRDAPMPTSLFELVRSV